MVDADSEYTAAASGAGLHTLETEDFELAEVTNDEMVAVYKSRMAKKGASGRGIYDELILSAPGGCCPLCGQRNVSTLDHHLPKKLFPALAVAPLNLVPACADCNKLKLDAAPSSREQETLHPYFDAISDDPWLAATVVETKPAAVQFFVDPPAHWDASLTERVKRHCVLFQLPKLYAAQAAPEISGIAYHLTNLYSAAPAQGAVKVRAFLVDQAESRRHARVNSWQGAMYQALADSTWYCDGGFTI
ncbi:hypothetical protein V2W30_39950 (plasmid) [Streptomyces sp. Q6]|uniref:Uncharacterized protein n=1 Tax=Streptomyces citrinus TaxID=3118173 RepID=A0ACD5AQ85_9ACTN